MPIGPANKAKLFIDTCISRGILREYFAERRAEVTDIMFTLLEVIAAAVEGARAQQE